MKITQSTAMNIVTEMKKIIGEDLTFMDTTCHIIACTDPGRIGDYHGASARMLREGLKEMSVSDDNTYAGTRSGINLTLELDDATVGVVGITGKEQDVIRYGQVVKRMTEILLMESALKDQKYNERQARNRFLQEWMTMDPKDMTQGMEDEGQRLGIRMDIPRRLALLERAPGSIMNEEKTARVDHCIRSILREDSRNLSGSTGGSYVILLTERPDSQIQSVIERIQQTVEKECAHRLIAGVDSRGITGGQLKQAYARARRTLRAAGNGAGLVFYDDILLEIVSNEVSEEAKREFLRRLFRETSGEKLREEIHLLQTLYACNGSIANSIAVNAQGYSTTLCKNEKGNMLLLALFNCLGPLLIIIVQYTTFASTGFQMWGVGATARIPTWLHTAVLILFVTPYISRAIYKRTRNPYIGGIINAVLVTLCMCMNSTTLLGA